MPYIKDGTNNSVYIPTGGGNGSAVLTDAYEDNLKCALTEEFKTANAKWDITNGTYSDDGLICNGYTIAEYDSMASLDTERAVIQFEYTSNLVIGTFLSKSLIWIDTANQTFNFGSGYGHSSTLPTATQTADLSFAFTQGHSYELMLERTLGTVGKAKLRDLVSGDEAELDVTVGIALSTKAFGFTVFSGQTTVNKFVYYAPLFDTAKVLIVGDSITYGGAVEDKKKRWGVLLIQEYLHNNGVQCGIGGSGSGHVISYTNALFDLGYSFDYVLIAMGTNDDTPTSSSKANYENIIATVESHGCEVIWCVPPLRSAGTHADRVDAVRTVLLSIDGLKIIRFDYATATNGAYDSKYSADGVHTNTLGSQRQYEFAKSALELWGIV